MTTPQISPPIHGRGTQIVPYTVFRVGVLAPLGFVSHGTGFLHHTGHVLTAHHVVRDLDPANIAIVGGFLTQPIRVASFVADADTDLAALALERSVLRTVTHAPSGQTAPLALPLLPDNNAAGGYDLGAPVNTWGFPGGYTGQHPILSVGYLGGFSNFEVRPGVVVQKFVINAAFNAGNSGGPLIRVDPPPVGVLGVVTSKLAPIPQAIVAMLGALNAQRSGVRYTATDANGQQQHFSEGQLIHEVLQYLRSQVQLVIGYATPISDVRKLLTANGIAAD